MRPHRSMEVDFTIPNKRSHPEVVIAEQCETCLYKHQETGHSGCKNLQTWLATYGKRLAQPGKP